MSISEEDFRNGRDLAESRSVYDATCIFANKGLDAEKYIKTFLATSFLIRNEVMGFLNSDDLPKIKNHTTEENISIDQLAMGEENHVWLSHNVYLNWLRLLGVLDPIDYDEIHKRKMYLLTNSNSPTALLDFFINHKNG